MGGKSSQEVTIGYWYKLGMQIAVCHGEVDAVSEIIIGERQAWSGNITNSTDIYIDRLDLFGGEDREGGVKGDVSVLFGGPNQGKHPYVVSQRSDLVSANRGLLTMVFGKAGTRVANGVAYQNYRVSGVFRDKLNQTYGIGAAIDAITANPMATNSRDVLREAVMRFDPSFNDFQFHTRFTSTARLSNGYNDPRPTLNLYLLLIFEAGTQANAETPFSVDEEALLSGPGVYRGVKYPRDRIFSNVNDVTITTTGRTYPFTWTAMNPYFKPIWVRVKNILRGWSTGAAWYPEKAQIGQYDMNPAHIVYRVLTDTNWGMGYNVTDIDDTSFRQAADVLYAEGFGLSFKWAREAPIEEFIQTVLMHIDANLRIDMRSGKFVLQLIRAVDVNSNTLRVADPSNVIELQSYARSTWGDGANEVVLTYKDRNEDDAVITVQNLAAVESQGGVISKSVTFNGIHDGALASRVAMRELNLVSTPLSTIKFTTNREFWDLNVSDVFMFKWPDLGINGVVYRITSIELGTFLDGTITVDAVEDTFNLPSASYVQIQDSMWSDPATAPKPIDHMRTVEASYFDVVHGIGERGVELLHGDESFPRFLAAAPQSDAQGFELHASPDNAISTYQKIGTYQFASHARLMADVSYLTTTLQVDFIDDIYMSNLKKPYLIIDDEAMSITSFDLVTMTINVARGINDTTPAKHYMLASVYIVDASTPKIDTSDRVIGERVYYRGLTRSPRGALPITSAMADNLLLTGRMWKPYLPGNVKINNAYYPDVIPNTADLMVTWASRNRLTQTVQHVPFITGNVASEPGVTYTIELYNADDVLIKSASGLTSTSYTWSSELTDAPFYGDGSNWYDTRTPPMRQPYIKVVLYSVRDGLSSEFKFTHVVRRMDGSGQPEALYGTSGYGNNYGDD